MNLLHIYPIDRRYSGRTSLKMQSTIEGKRLFWSSTELSIHFIGPYEEQIDAIGNSYDPYQR